MKRAVRALLHDLAWSNHLSIDLRDNLGIGGSVKDQIAVPPLAEHAEVSSSGFVEVAREEDGDRSASAEIDDGESVVEDGLGHGGEVVLHIDDEKCGDLRIRVSLSCLVLSGGGRGSHFWR